MRRLALLVAGIGLLTTADGAAAATVAREDDALVVRTVPGEADEVNVTFVETDTRARFSGEVAPGNGCAAEPGQPLQDGGSSIDYPAACDTTGVTRVVMLLGDGADQVNVSGSRLPVMADLAAGNDVLSATDAGVLVATMGGGDDTVDDFSARSAAIAAGPGNDRIVAGKPGDATSTLGRSSFDGAEGNDVIRVTDVPARLSGGPGDDVLTSAGRTDDDVLCGTGADRVTPDFRDRVGEGCPPHLGGLRERGSTLARFSRSTRRLVVIAGRVSEPATVSIRLRRLTATGRPAETFARGTLSADTGSLRGSLRPTASAVRRLRALKGKRLEVFAEITLRSRIGGADRELHTLRTYVRR